MIIKKTLSLCPQCYRIIPAEVVEKNNSVWMVKTCDEHGFFEGLIDRDPNFYRASRNSLNDSNEKYFYLIPITYQCNQNCSFCYVPRRDRIDRSIDWLLEKIDQATSKWSIYSLVLTGGETTLRQDLRELISKLRHKYPHMEILINTNGLVLSDEYVRDLKNCGLDMINISFSSFKEEDYRVFDETAENILSRKLYSLRVLKDTKTRTIISPTLVRGVNEDALREICSFALNNLDFVEEVRIRNASMVGRCKEVDSLTLSELVSLTEKALGERRGFFKMSDDLYHSNLGFGVSLIIDKGKIVNYLYGEYSRNSGHDIIVIMRIFLKTILSLLLRKEWCSVINYVILFKELVFRNSMDFPRETMDIIRKFLGVANLDFLRIRVWHWFDAMTIDLQEEKTGGGLHLMYDGSTIDACEAGMIRFNDI